MHVVWKRPDGFLNAEPSDFFTVTLAKQSKLWLHKTDTSWFPFRISGCWKESEATKKLNNLVNLLNQPSERWITHLVSIFNNSMSDDPNSFLQEIEKWLAELKANLSGDTWEMDIMNLAISEVEKNVVQIEDPFKKNTAK